MINIEHMRTICSGRIAIGEPLGPMTTFRIGGTADIYVEPMTIAEVLALQRYFRENNFPYMVLGNGSNLLVSDEGYRGAAINLEKGFSDLQVIDGLVIAGAGVRLATFTDFCIRHGYSGTEMLAGIPGTLGGALVMNAGAYGGEISAHLLDVTIARNGEAAALPRDACGFRYRDSGLRNWVLLSARFALPPGDREDLRRRRRELLLSRNSAQPVSQPNAGCIFKNPPGQHAGRLIEESGLKGHVIGGAEVSQRHANFIVAERNARAEDVLALINHVRKTVFDRTGVELQPEILLVGFPENSIPSPAGRKKEAAEN